MTQKKHPTLTEAYAGMAKGFDEMKARIAELEQQERRLNWMIEKGATVARFGCKFRVETKAWTLSGWRDSAIEAIDDAMDKP